MKYLLIILLFLTSCKKTTYIYINSIYIEYNDFYELTFIKKVDDSIFSYKSKGSSINDAINNINIECIINLNYITSIIINSNSLNNDLINELVIYSLNNININYYLFKTNDISNLLEYKEDFIDSNVNFFINPSNLNNIPHYKLIDFINHPILSNIPLLEI